MRRHIQYHGPRVDASDRRCVRPHAGGSAGRRCAVADDQGGHDPDRRWFRSLLRPENGLFQEQRHQRRDHHPQRRSRGHCRRHHRHRRCGTIERGNGRASARTRHSRDDHRRREPLPRDGRRIGARRPGRFADSNGAGSDRKDGCDLRRSRHHGNRDAQLGRQKRRRFDDAQVCRHAVLGDDRRARPKTRRRGATRRFPNYKRRSTRRTTA